MIDQVAILIKGNIRVYVTNVTKTAQQALVLHQLNPLPALVLGTAIAAFGPLGIMKKNGKVSVIINSDGPLANLVVDTNNEGDIRALIGNPQLITEYDQKNFNTIPLQLGMGTNGSLKVIHYLSGQTFGGEVKLAKGDIVTDLAYYFDQSEQIYSAVKTAIELANPTEFAYARSVIFQLLPGYDQNDIAIIEKLVAKPFLKNEFKPHLYLEKQGFKLLTTKTLQ